MMNAQGYIKSFKKIESQNGVLDNDVFFILKDTMGFLNLLKQPTTHGINIYLVSNRLLVDFDSREFYYSFEGLEDIIVDQIIKTKTVSFCFINQTCADLEYEVIYSNILIL